MFRSLRKPVSGLLERERLCLREWRWFAISTLVRGASSGSGNMRLPGDCFVLTHTHEHYLRDFGNTEWVLRDGLFFHRSSEFS